MALIEIRKQKNNSIAIIAPDGTMWSFPADLDDEALAVKVGEAALQIARDPEQPEVRVESVGGQTRANAGAGGRIMGDPGVIEANVRRTLDSVIPGGSGLLDFFQDISHPDETG